MQNSLKNIAQITSGFSFRGALPVQERGAIQVIQAKNIIPETEITSNSPLSRVNAEDVSKALPIHKGDVLLATRSIGSGGFKATTCGDLEGNVIASSSVCIIRLNSKQVLPQYLAIFLNSQTGQEILGRYASGAAVQLLLLRNVREIEIPIPPLTVQQNLINLLQNTHAQKQLLERQKELLHFINQYATNTTIESNAL